MSNPQRSFFFNVDWLMVFIYLALCTIGWFNIHCRGISTHGTPEYYSTLSYRLW